MLIVHDVTGKVTYEGERPSTIDISSDSTNVAAHITWSTWGPSTAVGTGTLTKDDCKPNCAQGTLSPEPATIELSDATGGHFTVMTERFGGRAETYHYPAYWASGAS